MEKKKKNEYFKQYMREYRRKHKEEGLSYEEERRNRLILQAQLRKVHNLTEEEKDAILRRFDNQRDKELIDRLNAKFFSRKEEQDAD